jgi:uncharacterized membrane protein YdjX (TVP38/TMEM64 family)
MSSRTRLLTLLPFAALVAGWLALGLQRQFNWSTLAAHQTELRAWVASSPLLAGAAYCATYVALIALSLPVGGLLTITGGLLFGAVLGALLAVSAASCGAILLFLLARGALAPALARRAGPLMDGVRAGLQRDGFSYLLAIRLLPAVPFWLGNLAPALVGMRLAPFAAATVLGIMPAASVLAWLGAGVGDVLAAGGQPDLSILGTKPVLLPLLGLSALSLIPVVWRRWRPARL